MLFRLAPFTPVSFMRTTLCTFENLITISELRPNTVSPYRFNSGKSPPQDISWQTLQICHDWASDSLDDPAWKENSDEYETTFRQCLSRSCTSSHAFAPGTGHNVRANCRHWKRGGSAERLRGAWCLFAIAFCAAN